MKRNFFRLMLPALLMGLGSLASPSWAALPSDIVTVKFAAPDGSAVRKASSTIDQVVRLDGTGASATIIVEADGLDQDITLRATHGFSVAPTVIKAGSGTTEVTVTHLTSLNTLTGSLILRSGDIRTYVQLEATGTPLTVKDISSEAVYNGGTDLQKTFDGFAPGDNGYTVEVKAKTDASGKSVHPFAVTSGKVGFESYIGASSLGLYNGAPDTYYGNEALSNPANGGTFYNTDGLYHTYRYAVTPDKRVFVYRDGMAIDTLRAADLALQPEWSVENGEMTQNLIKNGDFEGEHNFSKSRNITDRIEGWDVYPYDQYNSTQDIEREERSNEVDQNNHVLSMNRYKWNDGWSAGEISQVVDVAPNEVYSFSALAKGGQYNGSALGKIRIQDLQNDDNKVDLPVTSDSYETYATDFSTLANTKQIRVMFYLERAKWGASVSALKVDDVKLTGMSRNVAQQIGFNNNGADIAYFAFDNTGAYAPAFAELTTSTDSLTLDGTGATATIDVTGKNLTGDISVTATNGFEVSPATLHDGGTITVKNLSTLNRHTGRVILRSGDKRTYVQLVSTGTSLEQKDIAANPFYQGGTDAEASTDFTGVGDNGFTVEVKAKTSTVGSGVYPYAIAANKSGFESYITSSSLGLYNGAPDTYYGNEALSNPANGGTFYNTDGLYHTYRYAVTPDKRVFVYRDGMAIDTLRVADLALQPEWSVENGEMTQNLIKNGDFEGEHNFSKSRNITDRIEGWDVYPYDQYNSTQDIEREERSNEVDQNNHVLSMNRYKWNDGWSAGEVSQVVDVAPNEVYSFSALAKGGQYNGSALGKIRIQDLQNDDNKVDLPVTSDSYETYATDFSTLANTKQIRVMFYLERAKWGASVSALKIDDVKLTGMSRNVAPKIGFHNNDADIAYFVYDPTGAYAPAFASLTATADTLRLDGTGSTATFDVKGQNLIGDISVTATNGFEVSPATLHDGGTVTVKNLTTLNRHTGRVILRSGDERTYVQLIASGTPLEQKDLSAEAVYQNGNASQMTFDGFAPGDNGYTVEIKAKTSGKSVKPYAVTTGKVGFESYIGTSSLGLYNGAPDTYYGNEALSNPANGGTFYNTDGLYHTYRYAVTPDKRVFVYRDGMAIDTLRVADLALQPEWSVENGEMTQNLIKNGDFEGEHNFSKSRNITDRIEGWDVYPYDQYNSTQDIEREERSNEVDQNNHVLSMNRYKWNDGWSAGEISQVVDVAPNEVYSFSALAKGGQYNGSALGKIRIQDLQNDDNKVDLPVTSDSYETYATDFSTLANTKQIRVMFYLERAKWGASVSALKVDDVKLTGMSRNVAQQIGFNNNGADIAYFAFDNTGAYAPLFATLSTSTDTLAINGTGSSETFTVESANLIGDISVTATNGFAVSPTTIKANTGKTTVRVTNLTTLNRHTGRVILRSADERAYVQLVAYGSPLEVKDISENAVYQNGNDEEKTFEGFNPGSDGYTVEVKAKTDQSDMTLRPFAVSSDKLGFESYITSTGLGLYNGAPDTYYGNEALSNPANGGTFYNTDGLYHTYRYAVTPDKRVFVYRDGLAIDTLRVADLALQPEWSVETGNPVRNMVKNGDFEGEHNFSKSRNITDRIEGWDVYPYDQYNSTQDIEREERSNEVDQNNHVLSMNRYKWNDGWSAGEISQVVDVAPNEVYSFSALAKGGQYNGSALGKIRIQDLQNDDNKVDLPVTSDSYETYATDFSTLANTKQIRVMFYLERAKWGASVSALKVDDVKLTGYTRNVQQQIGFHNNGADIAYFAFDNTGAYAPKLPGLSAHEFSTAIQSATATSGKLRARVSDGMLYLSGVDDGSRVLIYNASGAEVAQLPAWSGDTGIGLPGRGIYVVAVFKDSKRQVVKVIY